MKTKEEKGCGKIKRVKCSDGSILPFVCPDDHLCDECKQKEISSEEGK